MYATVLRILIALALVACAQDDPPMQAPPPNALLAGPVGSGVDQDCDGVSDDLEAARGMSPSNPNDGRRDEDGDGLRGAEEVKLGGDPWRRDTDNDGEADTTDLLRGLDLDGDGIPTERDNCKSVLNAAQADADRDGIGDLCDETPAGSARLPTKVVHLAQHPTRRDFALLDAADPGARARPDLEGYLDTGTTFLMVSEGGPGLASVTELSHPSTKRHVYAISDAEVRRWREQGFTESRPFGALWSARPTYGEAASARRFERVVGGVYEQATTIAPRDVAALIATGFREIAALGWVLTDQGRLRKPRAIARHRRASDGATLHTMSPASEPLAKSFAAEGFKFRLLPEPTGWTLPVYRLRNAAGAEILSTVTTEAFGFEARGYTLEGVIGWVYRDEAAVQTMEDTTPFVRLSNGARYEHSADPDEIASLKSRGFGSPIVLGRAVRLPPRARRANGCVGDLDLVARLRQGVADNAPRGTLELQSLHTLAVIYTINRVLNGQVSGPTEQRVAKVLETLTAAARALLRDRISAAMRTNAAARAGLLGELASQDPFSANGPLDFAAIRYTTMRMMARWAGGGGGGGGTGNGTYNEAVSGGNLSLAKLRAPQCQGTTYAPTDPATPAAAQRAITTSILGFSETIAGRFHPAVFGVLNDGVSLFDQGDEMIQYALERPTVGFPLIGIDIGPCSSTCAATLGQRCYMDRCRQYPLVKAGSMPSFSGANFWDGIGAKVILTDADTNRDPKSFMADVGVEEVDASPNEMALRCDHMPVSQDLRIRSNKTAPLACPTVAQTPQCPADVSRKESERRLEKMRPTGPIDVVPGHFYQVQAQNTNGNYYAFRDVVSLNPAERVQQGRTVHVCVNPNCQAPPNPSTAACTVSPLPTCGGAVGGVWRAPPRSIELCRAFDFEQSPCPETPHVFRSENIMQGPPRLVYVESPEAPLFMQTSLEAIKCLDETGVDAFGDDELVIWFGAISNLPPGLDDIKQLTGGFRLIEMDINSGNVKRPPGSSLLGVAPLRRIPGQANDVLMVVMEDDDVSFGGVLAGIVAAVGTAATIILSGGAGAIVIGTAILAGGSAGIGALAGITAAFSEDDNIGKVSWRVTLDDLTKRSALTHDGLMNTAAVDPTPFPPLSIQDHVRSREAGRHPSVDAFTHDNNGQLVSCADARACTGGKICVQGACVPPAWTDPTLPLGTFDPAKDIPGVIERIHLDDEGEYVFWVSTSVSDEDGLTVVTP